MFNDLKNMRNTFGYLNIYIRILYIRNPIYQKLLDLKKKEN